MRNVSKIALSACFSLATLQAHSFNMPGYFVFEGGAYWPSQGESQNIYIDGLVGDRYSVDNDQQVGGVFGVGYLFHGPEYGKFTLDYGVNMFYLTRTQVSGDITQEFMFTNLSYEYSVNHYPVYATAKGHFKAHDKVAITFDAGIGPNFLQTSDYNDKPLNSYSLRDRAFAGSTETTTVFSAMAGVGVKLMSKDTPFEIGYRFFYLGEGSLEPRTDAIFDDLNTGPIFASAVIFTVSI